MLLPSLYTNGSLKSNKTNMSDLFSDFWLNDLDSNYLSKLDGSVEHRENEVILTSDMPGIPKESLDITLEDGVLNVKAVVEGDRPRRFRKSWRLNTERLDLDNINATLELGVLNIRIPRLKKETRRIEIKKIE